MRKLRITLFVLALLALTTQATRHVYVRYLEPRISVLDKYDETDVKKAIQSATSLSDLLKEYGPARKRVDQLEEEKKQEMATKTRDEYFMFAKKWKEDHKKEYEQEYKLKQAIQDWEEKSKKIRELRIFWLFGLVFFVAGAFMLTKGLEWLGIAFIIPGAVEMIWWTSPSFTFVGSPLEFDRLLINKLVFTLVTLVLVIVAWFLSKSRERKNSPTSRSS
ncbi:MAG: hypothetical protein P9M10_00520 [Candidatus Euphemobacter frigidus]|nr:hypothetical protein [Candidatus Euphemobacter frigidus]